jgi:ubiquitin carboxyl-terminal hydrolase L3
MKYEKHFIPLESDPAIFTSLMHELGVPKSFKFIDIWSLEANQLHNIRSKTQNPIEGLILILPDCPAYAEQTMEHSIPQGDTIWLQQTINNACGLYAILHCVCNILATKEIGKILITFSRRGI